MTTVLGTYAAELQAALAAAMTGYDWQSGEPVGGGPPPSAAVGYVWVTHTEAESKDRLIMHLTAMVRVYPVQAEPMDDWSPIDPAPLYQAVEDLQAALRPVQAPSGGVPWFFEVTAVDVTHDGPGQWVDAVVTGTGPNMFAVS